MEHRTAGGRGEHRRRHAQIARRRPVCNGLRQLGRELVWYRCNAYDEDVAKVLAAAEKWVAARVPQVAKPAIVLDIDETSSKFRNTSVPAA